MSGYSAVCSEKMCPQMDENVKKKLTRISNESDILGKMIELSGKSCMLGNMNSTDHCLTI